MFKSGHKEMKQTNKLAN